MTRNGSSGFLFFRAVQKYQEERDQRFGRGLREYPTLLSNFPESRHLIIRT